MPKIKDFLLSYVSIIISIISSLVMLPLYISHFGSEDYGAWIVVNTFIQYLALANFGLPTSLTIIASNLTNKELIKPLYDRSLKLISIIVLLVFLIFIIGVKTDLIKPHIFFGETNKKIFYFSCLIYSFILYCLRSPIQLSASVFLAIGKVYLNKFYEILNNVSMPLAFILVYVLNGNILWYIVISGGFLLTIAIASYIHSRLLLNNYQASKVGQIVETLPGTKEILKLSGGYFIISIGAALVWNTDNLVIAHYLPLSEVTIYSITFRIYTTAFLVFNTINNVLLPYYGIFKSQGRIDLLKKSFNSSIFISSFLAGIIWIFAFLFSRDIINFWTRDSALYGGKYLFIILGGYGFILAILSTISTLFSSMKIVKIMIIVTFAEGICNLFTSLLLVEKYGLYGIAVGTFCGALTSLLILSIVFNKYVGDLIRFPLKIITSNLVMVLLFIYLILFLNFDELNFITKAGISLLILSSFCIVSMKFNNLKISDFKFSKNVEKS